MSSRESAAEQAMEHAGYVLAYATGSDGMKAKAQAAQAMALVDLAESIRFAAILRAMTSPPMTMDSMDAFRYVVTDAKALAEVRDQ